MVNIIDVFGEFPSVAFESVDEAKDEIIDFLNAGDDPVSKPTFVENGNKIDVMINDELTYEIVPV